MKNRAVIMRMGMRRSHNPWRRTGKSVQHGGNENIRTVFELELSAFCPFESRTDARIARICAHCDDAMQMEKIDDETMEL